MNVSIASRGAKQRRRGPQPRAPSRGSARTFGSHASSRSKYTWQDYLIMKRATDSRLFRYSRYDAIPVMAALLQLGYLLLLFFAFPRLPWWALLPLGLVWSISISWNINGISHNFLHNPYFRSPALNRCFS